MTTLIAALMVVVIPFLAVSALLTLVEKLQDRRDRTRDQQIALTDAIHWELGAVAAPTVGRRLRGGWRVSMAVPLDQPPVVAALLRVTGRHFSLDEGGAKGLEIILTPRTSEVWSRAVHTLAQPHDAADRPLAA
jgi:hypothetical protein